MKKFTITESGKTEILNFIRQRSYQAVRNSLTQLPEQKSLEDLFKEIDQAIEENKSKTPVTIDKSKFLIKLKEIKEKWKNTD